MYTALYTAALVLGTSLCAAHDFGQRTSVIRLEAASSNGKYSGPFRGGDNLEIHETQPGTAAGAAGRRVTVLDVQHWPWVLVRTPQGEAWVNFDHVYSAHHTMPER